MPGGTGAPAQGQTPPRQDGAVPLARLQAELDTMMQNVADLRQELHLSTQEKNQTQATMARQTAQILADGTVSTVPIPEMFTAALDIIAVQNWARRSHSDMMGFPEV